MVHTEVLFSKRKSRREEIPNFCHQAGVRSFNITFEVYVILKTFEKYDNKRPDPICKNCGNDNVCRNSVKGDINFSEKERNNYCRASMRSTGDR